MQLGAGDSGADGPETPGCAETPVLLGRRLRSSTSSCSSSIWAAVPAQNPQIRGEFGKIKGCEHERKGGNHSNHEIHGPKPQETHTIERSIPRPNMGLFMKFLNLWWKRDSWGDPWQPKAADTNMLWPSHGGWPDLQGSPRVRVNSRGNEGENEG